MQSLAEMARALFYSAVVLTIGWPASVFASLTVPRSTGVELVHRLNAPTLVPQAEEAELAQEFDAFLIHAFYAVAGDPSDHIVDWAVSELFYIFARHTGHEVIDGPNQNFYREAIRDFVQPVRVRSPGSCVMLLDPRTTETIH